MFAIIRTGGKQYKVSKDDKIVVEKLTNAVGDKVTFKEVLLVGSDAESHVGSPFVAGAEVSATVEKHVRDAKIIVFKKKRRHNYRRKKGHKQHKTMLKILDVVHGAAKSAATSKAKAEAPKAAPKKAASAKTTKAAPKTAAKATKE